MKYTLYQRSEFHGDHLNVLNDPNDQNDPNDLNDQNHRNDLNDQNNLRCQQIYNGSGEIEKV